MLCRMCVYITDTEERYKKKNTMLGRTLQTKENTPFSKTHSASSYLSAEKRQNKKSQLLS